MEEVMNFNIQQSVVNYNPLVWVSYHQTAEYCLVWRKFATRPHCYQEFVHCLTDKEELTTIRSR